MPGVASAHLADRFGPTAAARTVTVASTTPAEQAVVPASSFEQVSIAHNENGLSGVHRGPAMDDGVLIAENVQARWLILAAYGVSSYRLAGGPDWISNDYFTITGTARGAVSNGDFRRMLRQLLADRFQLQVHTETRSTPIYTLVVSAPTGALGPKIQRASVDCPTLRAQAGPRPTTPPCGQIRQVGHLAGRGFPMSTLAGFLSPDAGRMVVDETGLDGVFEFDLIYTPEPLRHHPPDRFPTVDPEGPSLFDAVRDQLGLTLEPRETLGNVVVIDRIERPIQ